MTMRDDVADIGASGQLDLDRIERLLRREFAAFRADFARTPMPRRQDLRAFFIEWLAEFLPEAIPSSAP